MNLANNIVKYRQKNQLSQEQLANALNISRQSISKWETGENLPSIDNLISLSGLLDISLDELITGEPYLHFPYNYGKPNNRWPVWGLIVFMCLGVVIGGAFGHFYWAILGIVIVYIFGITFSPFDFKRYYDYWSLEKKGIRYLTNSQETYGMSDELLFPIKAMLKIRPTELLAYKQISKIEVKVDLYQMDPNTNQGIRMYSPSAMHRMQESFYFQITTIDGNEIYLDLKQYYFKKSSERQMLSTIISFLKRKNLEFIDKQGIAEIVMDRSKQLTVELYKKRDQKIVQSES